MWFYDRWFKEWVQGYTPLQSSICSYNKLLSSNLFLFCSSHLSLSHHLGYSLHLLKTTCYLYKRCFKINCTLIVDTLSKNIFYNHSVEIIQFTKGLVSIYDWQYTYMRNNHKNPILVKMEKLRYSTKWFRLTYFVFVWLLQNPIMKGVRNPRIVYHSNWFTVNLLGDIIYSWNTIFFSEKQPDHPVLIST